MILVRSIGVLFAAASAGWSANAPLPPDHAQRMARGLEMFSRDVAPILKEHCLKCHGGEKTKGDFDLSTREDFLKGGKDGPAVVPFDAKLSSVLKMIRHEEEPFMPDKEPKLPDSVIESIAAWIDSGAPYAEPLIAGRKPARDRSVVTDEDKNWWAFRPLMKTDAAGDDPSSTHPIDALLLRSAKGAGMTFAKPADSGTLLRRMYLDVTGIPPTPGELDYFRDASSRNASAALADQIDQLLASPRYGERWARHWLDVARFAESSGFEQDYDRPFAYLYRDFVIKALNMDMPYDQFVRWQLAGDEEAPENPLALTATGFLGAGVFPTQITANEVERTRYDAMDDMLSTTGSAMLGLTVGCARCHDHKYDPIPARDYYRLLSIFTTTVRSNIEVDLEPEKTRALRAVWEPERDKLGKLEKRVEKSLRPEFEKWMAQGIAETNEPDWILLEPTNLKSNAKSTFKPLGDGSYLVEGANGAHDAYTITAQTNQRRITGLKLETLTHPSLKRRGPGRASNGNFGLGKITITAAPLHGGEEQVVKVARVFADHEQNKTTLSVAASLDEDPGSGWAVDGQIGKDHAAVFIFEQPLELADGAKLVIKLNFSVNTQHGIGRPRFSLTNSDQPALGRGVLPAKAAAALEMARAGQVAQIGEAGRTALFDWWKQRNTSWQEAHGKLADHLAREPVSKTMVMICGEGYPPLVMHSQGAPFFQETFFLKRGNSELKDGVASPGFLQALMRHPDDKRWQWPTPANAKFSGRRKSLAAWMTDVDHGAGALLARVIVNRVWQHHFGRGIVSTPDDFGRQGSLPSQPALLDWLAREFIRGGWKLKPLHRLILTSAAYGQDTTRDPKKELADPTNDFFMRRTPQRLEGESIRDSLLAVSGLLDGAMFGPGTRDEMNRRRSIYFNIKRSELIGSMVAFDAPEPLTSQGSRPVTTVAPQALMLMNSPQVRACATALAKRIVADEANGSDAGALIGRGYRICFGRDPAPAESRAASTFVASQSQSYQQENRPETLLLALTDFCQVLFGSNEFVYQP